MTAENVAKKFNISREEQDNFALSSQKKTEKAVSQNRFNEELIEISEKEGKLNKDEHPRTNLELDDLQKLKTVFNVINFFINYSYLKI